MAYKEREISLIFQTTSRTILEYFFYRLKIVYADFTSFFTLKLREAQQTANVLPSIGRPGL
jgi:hypothetical protein